MANSSSVLCVPFMNPHPYIPGSVRFMPAFRRPADFQKKRLQGVGKIILNEDVGYRTDHEQLQS